MANASYTNLFLERRFYVSSVHITPKMVLRVAQHSNKVLEIKDAQEEEKDVTCIHGSNT